MLFVATNYYQVNILSFLCSKIIQPFLWALISTYVYNVLNFLNKEQKCKIPPHKILITKNTFAVKLTLADTALNMSKGLSSVMGRLDPRASWWRRGKDSACLLWYSCQRHVTGIMQKQQTDPNDKHCIK